MSLDHPAHHSGAPERSINQTQRRRGRHLSFLCHYGGNTAFKKENDEESDVEPGRGEEYVHVEVMFRNLVSNKNRKLWVPPTSTAAAALRILRPRRHRSTTEQHSTRYRPNERWFSKPVANTIVGRKQLPFDEKSGRIPRAESPMIASALFGTVNRFTSQTARRGG